MVSDQIHLLMATTSSMLMTFALQCILWDTRATNSVLQEFLGDATRDVMLSKHCSYRERQDPNVCSHFFEDYHYVKSISLFIVTSLLIYLQHTNNYQLLYRFRPVLCTIFIVWLVARFCDDLNLWYRVDVITVYLFVWQCAYLIIKWEACELSWPFLIVHQFSLCLLMASIAFVCYDTFLRYLPASIQIGLLWLVSAKDIFQCLHPQGCLRDVMSYTATDDSPRDVEIVLGAYCPYELEEMRMNEWTEILGLGDFVHFDVMVLLLQTPYWSMTTKVCVLIGSIVSIQVGHLGTKVIGRFWKQECMPGLPCPVVVFSIFTFIVNIIVEH